MAIALFSLGHSSAACPRSRSRAAAPMGAGLVRFLELAGVTVWQRRSGQRPLSAGSKSTARWQRVRAAARHVTQPLPEVRRDEDAQRPTHRPHRGRRRSLRAGARVPSRSLSGEEGVPMWTIANRLVRALPSSIPMPPDRLGSTLVLSGLAVAAVLATPAANATEREPAQLFATPMGTIMCAYAHERRGGAELRCDRDAGLNPPPRDRRYPSGECGLDRTAPPEPLRWRGLSMRRRRKAKPVCAAESLFRRYGGPGICATSQRCAEPVADRWSAIGFRCTVTTGDDYPRDESIRCANSSGHSFVLSPEGWSIH
jgi:hypothetical protein